MDQSRSSAVSCCKFEGICCEVVNPTAWSGFDVRRVGIQKAKKPVKNRFGLGGKAEVYLAQLRRRRRQPKESLQELGQTIRELCALSYPEFDEKGQDRLARGHFLDAVVTPEIREGLFRAQPRTLDDAVEAALNTEAFVRMEGQRNEVKR